jgi:hypothetical protein
MALRREDRLCRRLGLLGIPEPSLPPAYVEAGCSSRKGMARAPIGNVQLRREVRFSM